VFGEIRTFSRSVVACVLLSAYALLPAAAWMHLRLERADSHTQVADCSHGSGEHRDQHSHEHHDDSRCQTCQMIHACAKQAVNSPATIVTDLQPPAPSVSVVAVEVPHLCPLLPKSPRAPPPV